MNLTKSQVIFVEIDPEDFLHMILDGKIKLGPLQMMVEKAC